MRRGDLAALALAASTGGYMLLDGAVASLTGDYIAPGGQLGPWSALVQAAGIAPRSGLMHGLFLGLGAATLLASALFALGTRRGRERLMVLAALGLWYLPVGTAFGLLAIALLGRGRGSGPAPARPAP